MILQHAPLAPSAAPQWAYCSGSVIANLNAPDGDTQESREGTAAHWVGAECLETWKVADGGCPRCADWLDKTAPNGIIIDDKMVEGAQVLVDDVLSVAQEHGALRSMMIEHRVHMPQIHADNWGTFDCAIWVPGANMLYIWDYKHGHRENRARGNMQMIDYSAGLYNELKFNGVADQQVTVSFRIVQPFCYTAMGAVDEWRVLMADLRPYYNQLNAKANEAMTNPSMTSGKHCRDCAAVGTCPTARRSMYSLIDYVNEPYQIDTMDDPALAVEYRILRDGKAVLKERLDAIADELRHRVQNGSVATGFALESKPGRLAWKIPASQAIALASQFGIDASKPGVLTPTQTRDAAPSALRAAFKQTLEAVTERPAGTLQLINADDTIAARAFKRK